MEHCDDCGFRYASVSRAALPERLTGFGPRYRAAFAAVAEPRRRPAPAVWSPLEYACHVRDVFRVQRERLAQALTVDQPEFTSMRREERAVEERYNDQVPEAVLTDLAEAAAALGATFAALPPAGWERTGIYRWPRPAVRTMEWLGQHTVHEGEHHLRDLVW